MKPFPIGYNINIVNSISAGNTHIAKMCIRDSYNTNLNISTTIAAIHALIGIVNIQAQTIFLATPHLTALGFLEAPTPIMVVVIM